MIKPFDNILNIDRVYTVLERLKIKGDMSILHRFFCRLYVRTFIVYSIQLMLLGSFLFGLK